MCTYILKIKHLLMKYDIWIGFKIIQVWGGERTRSVKGHEVR